MDCARVTEELSALAQGELDPAAGRRVRAHLQDCAACHDEKTAIEAFFELLSVVPPVEVSAGFDQQLEARLVTLFPRSARPASRRRAVAEPRGLAFVASYLRHRVRTAPVLAASILLHFLLLSFLAVLVVRRGGAPEAGPVAWRGFPGGAGVRSERPLLKDLDRLPRDELQPPRLPRIDDEEPELPPAPRTDPLDQWIPPRRRAPSEVLGWLASRREPEAHLRRAGAAQSIPAIRRGLRWLAGRQQPDGSWSSAPDDRLQVYRTGVTGLALLAFLAEGHSAHHGGYQGVVRRSLQALRAGQAPSGLFGPARGNYLYNHIVALQALAENLLLERRDAQGDRARIERGLQLLVQSQHAGGGWGYEASATAGQPDSSVTGWAVFLLEVLRHLDVPVPQTVRQKSRAWFAAVTDATGRVGYRRRGDSLDGTFSLTCVGLLAGRLLAPAATPDPRQVRHCIDTALADLKSPSPSLSLWYHTTFALRHVDPAWSRWEPAVRAALLARQAAGGSWPAATVYGAHAGPAYTTAIALLTLQAHYRYK